MTSYPGRISRTWYAVESILRQRVPPDRLFLVLSEEEFPDRKLPLSLEARLSRGLEILWVEENWKSYKKLLPVRAKHPEAVIVTVDDDAIYRSSMLGALLREHHRRPQHVLGTRGRRLELAHGNLKAYRDLKWATPETSPTQTLLTGVGGVLYPPEALSDQVFDIGLAWQLCPTADDIWFWAMAMINNTPVRRIPSRFGFHRELEAIEKQVEALSMTNILGGGNDDQLFQVIDHFSLWQCLNPVQQGP